jgi:hypothetical protein
MVLFEMCLHYKQWLAPDPGSATLIQYLQIKAPKYAVCSEIVHAQVPRKSYRDYQADIYPDTAGPAAAMGPLDWLEGAAVAPPRISLNPAQRPLEGKGSLVKNGPALADLPRKMLGKNSAVVTPSKATNGQVNGTRDEGRKLSSGSSNNHQIVTIATVPSDESTKEVETKKNVEATSSEQSR